MLMYSSNRRFIGSSSDLIKLQLVDNLLSEELIG